MSYTVTLLDYPDLAARERHHAESRFRQALDCGLGGAGGVLVAWRAWQKVEGPAAANISDDEYLAARRWLLATERARAAGLAGLDDLPHAVFFVEPGA